MDVAPFLRALARRSFGAILVLVPFVMFPWTVSPLEINKQAVFYLLATVCILAWLGEALLHRAISFSFGKVWIPFVALAALVVVSAVCSADPYTSIFGQSNQEYTSAVTTVLLVLVAFVGTHIVDGAFARKLGMWWMISATVVGALGILPFFHVSFDAFPTNVVGTPNALAIFLLVSALFGAGLMIVGAYTHRSERAIVTATTIMTTVFSLMVLLAIDYVVLWVLAIIGAMTLFGLSFVHPVLLTRPARFVPPMILFVSGLFFSVLPTMVQSPFYPEVALSHDATWNIARESFAEGDWLLGAGPGTFSIAFNAFHGSELNATDFWDTRFDRGSSAFLTALPTVGLFATLAMMIGIVLVTVFAVLTYRKSQHPQDLPWIAAWIAIAIAWMVYPQNMTLTVVFWILLSLVIRTIGIRVKAFTFDHSPRAGFAAALFFVVSSVFILTVTFATISKYRADVAFAQAVNMSEGGQSIDDVILALDDAASANRWSDVYYRNLASALLQKVIALAGQKDADPELVKSLIGAAVNAGIRATDLGPSNVTNWEMRGDVYREVSPLVADAATFAVAAYQEAVTLAPNNPRYTVGLARGYLAYADVLTPIVKGDDETAAAQAKTAQDDALQKASDTLLAAITLKSDYAEARYYLASVQERQGKLAEAVASMELVRSSAPSDVGVGLQLSLLYLRQGKNDLAKNELNRIIALAPNFSNAHWYLAAVLEEEDDIDGALIELESIMKIDPGNETVQKKIDELKAGQVAATVVPDPLPTSETPALPDAGTTTP